MEAVYYGVLIRLKFNGGLANSFDFFFFFDVTDFLGKFVLHF